jgi:hypothetical protein
LSPPYNFASRAEKSPPDLKVFDILLLSLVLSKRKNNMKLTRIDSILDGIEKGLYENKNMKWEELPEDKKFFWSIIRVGLAELLGDVNQDKTAIHKARILYILNNCPGMDMSNSFLFSKGPKDLYKNYLQKTLNKLLDE